MAKKKTTAKKIDRSDPKQNKSLAIRNVLGKMPAAKAAQVAEAVQKEYGHRVSLNMIYMVKTKNNMAADGRPLKRKGEESDSPMRTPAQWVEAIKNARQLLSLTGSVANATALLKAVDSQ